MSLGSLQDIQKEKLGVATLDEVGTCFWPPSDFRKMLKINK